jgi:DNA-binding CsgD family transcriptional regulator
MSGTGTVRSIACKVVITKPIEGKYRIPGPGDVVVNFPSQQEDFVSLTDREREVLECIARGLSSKQCALQLGIAPRTVERHVENLRNKLNARNKPHLVAKALAAGHI